MSREPVAGLVQIRFKSALVRRTVHSAARYHSSKSELLISKRLHDRPL